MSSFLDRRLVWIVLLGAVGPGAICLASDADAATPVTIDVPEGVADWVVHEESGRVFASLSDGDEVVEYGPSAREVRRFKVGPTPTEMILKRDRLIVACTKSPSLHVIDLKTNNNLGAIEVNGRGPYGMFCSQVGNGYAYCICNTGDAWWDGEIFQVDLNAMKIRKQQKVQGWGQSHVLHVAMSRDGKWIVPDARGASSPSGADLMKVDEDELTFTQIRDYHKSFGQMVAGPFNRYWTFGSVLYTLDITKSIRTFSGSPVAIHPRLDLAVSRTSNGLVLERFSDASPIVSVPLEAPAKTSRTSGPPTHARSLVASDPTIQFDLKNDLVFAGDPFRGYWVDLGQFKDKLSPLMIVQAPSEVTSLVGNPLRIPLAVTNGGEKANLTISQRPEGMKLEGGDLVWNPQAEDVGFTTVELTLKSTEDDRTLDTVDVTVHVTLPKVDLGFYARSMELAPSSRYLLVWGLAPGEEGRHPAHTGADDVAVIDIQERKILARKTLPQGIRCATIDDDYVYISPNSGNLFHRLDRSLGQGQRMFLQSAPTQLVKIGKDRLVAVGGQMQFFQTEPLEPVSDLGETMSVDPRQGIRCLGHKEVELGNRIVERATGKLVAVTGFVSLPLLVEGNPQPAYNPMDRNQLPARWGRRLAGNTLTNSKGSRISQWAGPRVGILSERWPMAILIASSQDGAATTTTMELANLVDGLVEHTSIIDVSSNSRRSNSPSFYGQRNTLIAAGDKVLVLQNTELLIATIPQKIADAMPMPTHFLPQQLREVEAAQPAKLKLAVAGKTDSVTFSLMAEYPGVVLDSGTGELTIDTPTLWDSFVKRASAASPPVDPRHRSQPSATSREENARRYQDLTGKALPADELAAQVPVSAVVQDSEGQEDSLQFSMIVVGSRKQLDEALAARQAEAEEQRAAMQAARQVQEETRRREAAHQSEVKADESVDQRLEALEARVRRMEAALDAILKRLDER